MDAEIELLADAVAHERELVELRARWAAEQGRDLSDDDPFAEEYGAWLRRVVNHREFWVARFDGAPVGMVNLLVFDRMPTVGKLSGGWGYLCNMYVDEDHRSHGIGAVLAAELLEHADKRGLERVVLSPSERSRPFYASLGFGPASNLLLRPRS